MAKKNGKPLVPMSDSVDKEKSLDAKIKLPNGDLPPIKWQASIMRVYPESVGMKYTNHVIVQGAQHEFVISFFEMKPPELPDELRPDSSGEIIATCVSQMVVPKTLMRRLHEVIGEILEQDKLVAEQAEEERKAAL